MSEFGSQNNKLASEKLVGSEGAVLKYSFGSTNIENYAAVDLLATVLMAPYFGTLREPMLVMRAQSANNLSRWTLVAADSRDSLSFTDSQSTSAQVLAVEVRSGSVVTSDEALEFPRQRPGQLVAVDKMVPAVRLQMTPTGEVMVFDLSGEGVAVTALWEDPVAGEPSISEGAQIIDFPGDFPPQSTS